MKPELLDVLACPRCSGALRCTATESEGAEVREGTLHCVSCATTFPVRGGVPRMLPPGLSTTERATARAFGTQWQMLAELSDIFREEFRSYLEPLRPDDLRGLAVLDAGCGMGKFSYAAAEAGARLVVAVDLSEAIDVAYGHLRRLPNAHAVQASIYELPFRPGTFDFAFSIGVVHHLPDPERGFRRILPLVVPGGRALVWLYALEGNEVFVRLVDPFRRSFFSRVPTWVSRFTATLLAIPLWLVIKTLYAPLAGRALSRHLPYSKYFLYFHRLGFWTFWGTVYDKLVPPIAFYLTRDTIRGWVDAARFQEIALTHRNGNSWTCLVQRPT